MNASFGPFALAIAVALRVAPVWAEDRAAPSGRFIVQGNTVTDRHSGLVWQRCSVGQRFEEERGCVGLARKVWFHEARRLEDPLWRLPELDELRMLYDQKLERIVDEAVFPDAPATWYWVLGKGQRAAALGVSCGTGGNDSCYQSDARAVRLVRRVQAALSVEK